MGKVKLKIHVGPFVPGQIADIISFHGMDVTVRDLYGNSVYLLAGQFEFYQESAAGAVQSLRSLIGQDMAEFTVRFR